MRKLFLFVPTIALALASCSNDEDLGFVNNNTGNAIEFRTLMDKSSNSRAAITDETSILSFTLTGIKKKGTDDDGYLFNAFGITRGEDANNKWDYTPKRYWPKDRTVDFYAYSPSSSKNITAGQGLADYVKEGTITYTVPQISKKDVQEDFLVAKTEGKSSGAITLNFHHALSRIMFLARTTQKNVTYTIDKIELVNLYETGKLNLSDTGIKETGALTYPYQPWTDHSSLKDYAIDMGESPVYMLNDYASVLGESNAVMVLPQATTLYSGTGTPASEFAVKVSYKAFVDDIYYAGSKTQSEVKYFPVKDPATKSAIVFEMGRQYNFFLEFGDEVGEAISFNVGVSDWTNAPASYLPEIDNYISIISPELAELANTDSDDTNITQAEIDAVKDLVVSTESFDFKGIEYFTNLESISMTGITNAPDLDISKNMLLTSVSITGSNLGTVNLLNGALTTLKLSGDNTITSLDASNNKLKTVTLNEDTKVTGDLNLSANPSLTEVFLKKVTVTGKLNLSDCALQDGDIIMPTTKTGGNIEIGYLDLSNNKFNNLEILNGNFENLDVSNNATLEKLDISATRVNQLLDATGNTGLQKILTNSIRTFVDGYDPEKGLIAFQPVKVGTFDISNSTKLTNIYVFYGAVIDKLVVWNSWDTNTAQIIFNGYSGEANGRDSGYITKIVDTDNQDKHNPAKKP